MNIIKSVALSSVLSATANNKGAEFTAKSLRTNKDYTFQISRNEFQGKWYTHLYVETEYLQFKHLGTYLNGKVFKKREVVETPSAIAIGWILAKVEEGKADLVDAQVQITHLGKCLRCGRTLTDATSIEIGLGPVCRS
jgi:hypothetical protein